MSSQLNTLLSTIIIVPRREKLSLVCATSKENTSLQLQIPARILKVCIKRVFSIAIILMGKRELIALLNLSSGVS